MADSGSGGKSAPNWSRMEEGGGTERGSTGAPNSVLFTPGSFWKALPTFGTFGPSAALLSLRRSRR